MDHADFSGVTELPGGNATAEQLSMSYTRYHFASGHVKDKEVLEAACGAGLGLNYLARTARRVVGGDIDETNLGWAQKVNAGNPRVEVQSLDAQQLPFEDRSFDVVILFEAIYYLPHPDQFFQEARRVLRPGGVLLLSTVNKEWGGFNPSPHSQHYFSAAEIREHLEQAGYQVELFGGFPDAPDSWKRRLVAGIRKAAVRLRLIPKTMRGKEFLKKLFYGKLRPLGPIEEGMAQLAELGPIPAGASAERYKELYVVGSTPPTSSTSSSAKSE